MSTPISRPNHAGILPIFSQHHDQAEPHQSFLRVDLTSGTASIQSEDLLEEDLSGCSLSWSITPTATWDLIDEFISYAGPLLAQITAGHSVQHAGLRIYNTFNEAAVEASDNIARLAGALEDAAPCAWDAVEYAVSYYGSVSCFADLVEIGPSSSDHDLYEIVHQLIIDALDDDWVVLTSSYALYVALCELRDAMSGAQDASLDIDCQPN